MPRMMLSPNSVDVNLQTPNSLAHQKRAHRLIPGAAHTYAKGDDQFPEHLAPVIRRGEGCRVWDLDDNMFVEYGAGVRSITLGHGYRPVCDAAYAAMLNGTNFVRPAEIELKAAEAMLSVIDGADMVKFGKNGSDAVSGAVKLARAYTGRELVAVCGDQPFFSVDDWFIGSTAMNSGIPQSTVGQTLKFKYNDLENAKALFEKYPGQIACFILEAETVEPPATGYLHRLQTLCHEHGAVFILDETITGFRWHIGGAQKVYGIRPDLSTFGKGMANGFSVSALCGKRDIMKMAGIEHDDRERCFVLSLTHGGETSALAACIATIDAYKQNDVIGRMERQGTRLRKGVLNAVDNLGLADYFQIMGRPQLLMFATCDQSKQRSQPFRTLFLQEMIKNGVLAPNLVVHAAHDDEAIDHTIHAVEKSLAVYKKALDEGVEKYLIGRSVKPVFRKFN
ncbi:MAG: glutamate-1-semialdehyde 2,1-aminomutase [Tepidisphaeraceae bacterium]